MGIISSTLFALLSAGDRVVSIKDTYGGTSKLFFEFLPKFNVNAVLCDTSDHAAIEAEIAKGCKLVYLETPTNPTIKILDLERLIAAAQKVNAIVVVDNTFATPINQNPLQLGADLVLHSATKFLGGHADALGGVICGTRDLVKTIYHFREINGATLHPMAAYLLLRGMKTLHLRVARQNENAMDIARFLFEHPAVGRVYYPGLETHDNYDIACRQMSGFGGMLSFELKENSLDAAKRFLPRLKFAHAAANLGAVEPSWACRPPPAMWNARHRSGLPWEFPKALIRYSTGIEDSGT